MGDWLHTLIEMGALIGAVITITTFIKKGQKESNKECRFMMKMLFEIIDILDGKDINGQVKKLRKEAEKFNVDN